MRQVITLGSPYRMVEGDRSSAQTLWEQVQHLHDGDLRLQEVREQDRPPLLVPATSIYSRTDGVAPWQTCIDEVREHTENIEVRGSHIGMGINPAVVAGGARPPRQPEGDWRPFAAAVGARSWYPKPAGWHERRRPATGPADIRVFRRIGVFRTGEIEASARMGDRWGVSRRGDRGSSASPPAAGSRRG